MASPVGMWNVVTNLQNLVLNIVSADNGEMTGTIEVAPSVSYPVAGTWTAASNEVDFSYSYRLESAPPVADIAPQAPPQQAMEASRVETIVRDPNPIETINTVQFGGYIFQAGKPLFNEAPGPTTAAWNMMAGTWSGGGEISGWTARSQEQLS
jgi:hypothetical protein